MVWGGTSGNAAKLCERGERKSRNYTIYRKNFVAITAFLFEQVSKEFLSKHYKNSFV